MRSRAAAVILALAASTLPAGAAVPAPAARPQPGGWGVDGRVYAAVVLRGTVYVGGRFERVVGPDGTELPRQNLAAFSLADGRPVTSWRADASAVVRALETDGTSLWAGGYFRTVDGAFRRGVAKLDAASGEVDTRFDARLVGGVEDLDVEDGRLYVGGSFDEVGGVARSKVAKLVASTGAPVRRFRARVGGRVVFSLQADRASARLYVGGAFNHVQGRPRKGLAMLDGRTGRLKSRRLPGSRRPVLSMDLSADGKRLYTGDGKNYVTGRRPRAGTTMWSRKTWGNIQAVHLSRGRVYFGFHEGLDGRPRARVAAADARTGRLLRWYPRFRGYWGVYAIGTDRRNLVVGGEFDRVEGVPAKGWASFDR